MMTVHSAKANEYIGQSGKITMIVQNNTNQWRTAQSHLQNKQKIIIFPCVGTIE